VSQALARVREAAKRNRRERFTSLMHHLTPALLAWAFHQLKPKAAPGVDGVTWEEYGIGYLSIGEVTPAVVTCSQSRGTQPCVVAISRPVDAAIGEVLHDPPHLSRGSIVGPGRDEDEQKVHPLRRPAAAAFASCG